MVRLLAIVSVIALGLWGYHLYQQSTLEDQSTPASAPLPSAPAKVQTKAQTKVQKCVRETGEVIYSDLSAGEDCMTSEVVEISRTNILPSSDNEALDTDDSSRSTSNFRCDGRQHCSQMTSCEEATYFINHCPNTKMDGDGDGVPCESQFCNLNRLSY